MNWFWRKGNPDGEAVIEAPTAVVVPPPRLPVWRRMGVPRLFGRAAPAAIPLTTAAAPVATPVPAAPEAVPVAPVVPVVPLPAARSGWQKLSGALSAAGRGFDHVVTAAAVPFGVHVREPRKRYAILLGVFAFLFAVGALPVPYVPLAALAAGYVGVVAISRAWVANERERTAIVKKLKDADPDALPDLRRTALVSALLLLILFPLAFMQVHRHFGLYDVDPSANFLDWVWFSLDKTYLKALPDWSILYNVHISSIDFNEPWGRHLVLLSRLTFDYILLQGVYRLLSIRATIREAVAVVRTDPDVAVRVGKRAIPALVDKLSDADRAVRGAAANAITQLGDPEGMQLMHEALAADTAQSA